MRYISGLAVTRTTIELLTVLTILIILIFFLNVSFVGSTSSGCKDLMLVFGRGSSQNTEGLYTDMPFSDDFRFIETESGAFFQEFESQLKVNYPEVTYNAASVHNFPDKYNPKGYEAKGVFGIPTLNNMVQARFDWWPVGEYRSSVLNGKEEMTGFIRDEMTRCPDQLFVLGGYSQGAQVVGEALFDFSNEELERINGVALFGDPKFIAGSSGNNLHFWKKSQPYPWKRGTASEYERGIASPRQPYVPAGMEKKTYSWCFADDFVCSGVSGLRFASDIKRKNEIGHTRYKQTGIPHAVKEIVQDLAPTLYAKNKANGGIDVNAGLEQPVPQPNTAPIDITLLVNTSGEVKNTLSTIRYHGVNAIKSGEKSYDNTRYGVVDFSEQLAGSTIVPRLNIRQDLEPFDESKLFNTLVRKLSWGGDGGGGIDIPDPHGLAIEKTVQAQSWNKDATKHIILFTDRPAKEMVSYNVCDGSVKNSMLIEVGLDCTEENVMVDNRFGSLYCDTIRLVIIRSSCPLKPANPTNINIKQRTLDDALLLASSKGIAVTVVVHRPAITPDNNQEAVYSQLRSIANATGGLFLQYDTFEQGEISDVLWRVYNHKPAKFALTTLDSSKLFEGKKAVSAESKPFAKVKNGVPTILDVSDGTTKKYQEYWWDFDSDGTWDKKTNAPTVEYVFRARHNRDVLTVAGVNRSEVAVSSSFEVKVDDYSGPAASLVVNPVFDIPVTVNSESDRVVVNWEVIDGHAPGVVFIGDSQGSPIISVPYQTGTASVATNELGEGGVIQLWLLQNGVTSKKITKQIN